MAPADLRYTKDHEWVRLDGETATIGITDFAQDALGDVVIMLESDGVKASGRGVATEAIGLVTAYAFDTLGLRRLTAGADRPSSGAAAARLGAAGLE